MNLNQYDGKHGGLENDLSFKMQSLPHPLFQYLSFLTNSSTRYPKVQSETETHLRLHRLVQDLIELINFEKNSPIEISWF